VVLTALIGRDGAVRKLTAMTGDDQLALAAADAVRQWKFKPYAPQGRAMDFETQITVNFTLP
jgi:TonB family protein